MFHASAINALQFSFITRSLRPSFLEMHNVQILSSVCLRLMALFVDVPVTAAASLYEYELKVLYDSRNKAILNDRARASFSVFVE